ncbi:tetratricopeptide repeat protein [Pedobacter nototheniae]|uniref:tetratricopeptide repeat protein n=1 Tax=Pedobacter nototheniae TaxID=2488994 RepID=UPI00292D3AE1|nr:tetratricopeptide repeat protein [Pedobacter nototheniae]
MKKIIIALLTILSFSVYAQDETFEQLMINGKAEFKKEHEAQNYDLAVKNLEKAVQLKPDNAEAHYFLGYAYSRLNSKDGKGIIGMTLPILIKTSEHLEKVNKLSPKYKGEMLILDPYSKISSEWGSMAMNYIFHNKIDSAKWAFAEGIKRGGFDSFVIKTAKNALDACTKDAILISYGDSWTFPLWYLQYNDGYRKDVSIIDLGLLNTKWYPHFLTGNKTIEFGLQKAVIDSLEYIPWKEKTVTIKNTQSGGVFSWKVKPRYAGQYLGKDDILVLSLLKKNEFKRPVYFTRLFDDDARLSLTDNITEGVSVDKLNIDKGANPLPKVFKAELINTLELAKEVNFNSEQEVNQMNSMRYLIYVQAKKYIEENKKAEAADILQLIKTYLPEDKFPVSVEFKNEIERTIKLAKQ